MLRIQLQLTKANCYDINYKEYDENKMIGIYHLGISGGDVKKNILDELKKLGIDKSTIFPEIEYQAEVVKEIYGY